MIEFRVNAEEVMVYHGDARSILVHRLRQMGFTTFEGHVDRFGLDMYATYMFHFHPTRRDLIFKRFDRWTPPWQNRKDILSRRFKL